MYHLETTRYTYEKQTAVWSKKGKKEKDKKQNKIYNQTLCMRIKNTYTNNSTQFIRLYANLKTYHTKQNVFQLHDEKVEMRRERKIEQEMRFAHSNEQYNGLNFLCMIQNYVFISDGQ